MPTVPIPDPMRSFVSIPRPASRTLTAAVFLVTATVLVSLGGCDAVEDVIDTIDPQPELHLTIANTLAPASRSTAVHVLVTVSNPGQASATNTVVALTLPDRIASFAAQPGTTCQGTGSCFSSDQLLWNVGELTPGESKTIALPIRSNQTEASSFRIAGTANADNADGIDASATWTAAAVGRGTVELSLTALQTGIRPSASVPARLRYLNTSNRAYDNTEIAFSAPAGVEIVDGDGGTVSGQTVRWSLGRLEAFTAGESDLTLRVASSLDEGEQVVVSARISSSTEALSGEARHPFVVLPTDTAGLIVTSDTDVISSAGRAGVVVAVTNPLPRTINDATAYLRLPLDIESFTAPPNTTCFGTSTCFPGDAMRLALGSLAPSQTRTFSFVIDPDLPAGQSALLSLSASAGGDWEGGFPLSAVSSSALVHTWRIDR